jgi:hypothetical protein
MSMTSEPFSAYRTPAGPDAAAFLTGSRAISVVFDA